MIPRSTRMPPDLVDQRRPPANQAFTHAIQRSQVDASAS